MAIGHADSAQEDDDISLVRAALRGEQDAFRQIVWRYETRLIAYLTQMLGNGEEARDLAQETFVAAFRALPQWRQPEIACLHPLAPWLYRIATNRALTHLRREAHYGHPVRLDGESPHEPLHLSDMSMGQPSLEDRTAARDLLRAALQHLSEADSACLVLHYVAGERYSEIAARLGMTSEAVRKRVSRGLAALRVAYHALDVEALP